jgi:hypothetical protein
MKNARRPTKKMAKKMASARREEEYTREELAADTPSVENKSLKH